MYELNPERNSENMLPFNHKTDNQPTVGMNVNHDHNIGVHDSLKVFLSMFIFNLKVDIKKIIF